MYKLRQFFTRPRLLLICLLINGLLTIGGVARLLRAMEAGNKPGMMGAILFLLLFATATVCYGILYGRQRLKMP